MAKYLKKKGFKRFFLGLGIYSVVFVVLAALGLTVFWNFIDAYELSRPKNAIAPYVQQLTREQMAAGDEQLIAQIDHNIQSEEACKEFIVNSLPGDITYAQNVTESTDTQLVYMLLSKGKAIGKVTLGMEDTAKFGFAPWKVTCWEATQASPFLRILRFTPTVWRWTAAISPKTRSPMKI